MNKLILVLLVCLPSILIAESRLKVDQKKLSFHEMNYEVVQDSLNKFTFDSEELPWKPITGILFVDHVNTTHSLFRYEIVNEAISDREMWVYADLHWEDVTIYCNGIKVGRGGKTLKRSLRTIDDNYQIIPLTLKAESSNEIIFDVNSRLNYGTKVSLISPDYFLYHHLSQKKTLAFFYGLLAVLFVINLVWFLITGERLRLAYSLYVFSMAYFSGKADNFMFYSLFPESPDFLFYEYYLNKLVFAWGLCFYLWTYLGKSSQTLKSRNFIVVLGGVYTLQYLIELLFLGSNYYYHTLTLLVWLLLSSLMLSKGFVRNNMVLFFALFVVCAGVSINMIQSLSWRSFTNQFTIFASDYSFIIDAFLFAVITANKVKYSDKQKMILQETLIDQMKENEMLNDKVMKELESKVQERTADLNTKNDELYLLNNKLKLQTDEIMRMNEELDLSNHRLKRENKEILSDTISGIPVSLDKVKSIYPDRLSCLTYLKEIKWGQGFTCGKCSNDHHKDLEGLKGKRCSKCGTIETITANTLFERLRIPLEKAFYLAYLVLNHQGKLKSTELSIELDLSQKTCYNFISKCNQRKELLEVTKKSGWDNFIYLK